MLFRSGVAARELAFDFYYAQLDFQEQLGAALGLSSSAGAPGYARAEAPAGEPLTGGQELLFRHRVTNVGIVYNQHHGHVHLEDFAALVERMKPHLQVLNLNGTSGSQVAVNEDAVLAMTASPNHLYVNGDDLDTLNLIGAWAQDATPANQVAGYVCYTSQASDPGATPVRIYIQNQIGRAHV